MKIRNVVSVVAIGTVLGLSLGFAPRQNDTAKPAPKTETVAGNAFTVDGVHSSLIFKIKHMGLANFYGRFNELDGSYTLDESDLTKSQFSFEVKTESVDTGNKSRDGHLKSPDFFNAAEYPTISFKSTKVEKKGDNHLNVTGDLTMHGVTKPVTVDMTISPTKQMKNGFKSGLDATFTVKRTDFEMHTSVAEGSLGDEVTLMVAIEGGRK